MPHWINGGVYVFDREVFAEFPDLGDHEVETFPRLAQEGRIAALRTRSYWTSIDSFKDLREAENFLAQEGTVTGFVHSLTGAILHPCPSVTTASITTAASSEWSRVRRPGPHLTRTAPITDVASMAAGVRASIEQVLVGMGSVIELALAAVLSGGHVLIEDVPGIGKTTLARSLAESLRCSFRRIQCTPDLMPSDITGVHFFNQKLGEFEFRPGPILAQIVLQMRSIAPPRAPNPPCWKPWPRDKSPLMTAP